MSSSLLLTEQAHNYSYIFGLNLKKTLLSGFFSDVKPNSLRVVGLGEQLLRVPPVARQPVEEEEMFCD